MVTLTAADRESRLAQMKVPLLRDAKHRAQTSNDASDAFDTRHAGHSQEKVERAGMVVPPTMQPDGDIEGVFVRYLRARK